MLKRQRAERRPRMAQSKTLREFRMRVLLLISNGLESIDRDGSELGGDVAAGFEARNKADHCAEGEPTTDNQPWPCIADFWFANDEKECQQPAGCEYLEEGDDYGVMVLARFDRAPHRQPG